jgi:hypothetical protein
MKRASSKSVSVRVLQDISGIITVVPAIVNELERLKCSGSLTYKQWQQGLGRHCRWIASTLTRVLLLEERHWQAAVCGRQRRIRKVFHPDTYFFVRQQ